MSEECKDTKIEPKLTPLSVEEQQDRTSNNSNKARVVIRTQSFLEKGQQAFLLSRQFLAAVQCYEGTGKERSLKMKESFK